MKNPLKISALLITVALFFSGCGNVSTNSKPKESTTSGNIKIAVDEAYQLLMEAEIFTFESIYTDSAKNRFAKINASYKPEGDAIADLLNDSVRLVVCNRKLTDAEEKMLNSKKIFPKTTKIAVDALAFIINKDNPDSLLQYDQIKEIFTGKITKWSQIDPKSALSDMTVVFDNTKSCNTRYIKEKFNLTSDFPSNCYAVKTNSDVIDYVEKNKNALGVISANWISDEDDTITHNFMKRIRVVSVGAEGVTDSSDFYIPHVGYIAKGWYPFTREVYMISRETFTGLGTGFVSFVAGDQGQRIVLKAGMLPATMPIRLIKIKNE